MSHSSSFILCLYVCYPNSLHSPLRFFSLSSHIAGVNLVFHFSPPSFIFFLLHGFVLSNIMYFVTTSLHSSLRFHAIFNYVIFFLSLFLANSLHYSPLFSTIPRSLSHTPHLTTSWPFTFATATRFLPFTFLYSTQIAANSPFTQSRLSLLLFLLL